MIFISIVLLAVLAAANCNNILNGRIVGGEICDIADFPHQLSLRIGGRHNCGASVIAPRYALTAAHCLEKRKYPEVTLRGGSSNYTKDGKIFEAVALFMHPNYKSRTSDYDVGLVKTRTDMVGLNIQAIGLPGNDGNVKIGKTATVSGWGYMAEAWEELSQSLRCVNIPTVDQDLCNTALQEFGGVRGMMFCAGAPGRDACQGDSGGPIIMDGIQIGIVSGGMTCGSEKYFGVYTRISQASVRAFITNVARV